MERNKEERKFSNYRDTMIPRIFKVRIKQALHLIVSDEAKKLREHQQLFHAKLINQTSFEMARTLKDSYFIKV
jgi:hypothetical protein